MDQNQIVIETTRPAVEVGNWYPLRKAPGALQQGDHFVKVLGIFQNEHRIPKIYFAVAYYKDTGAHYSIGETNLDDPNIDWHNPILPIAKYREVVLRKKKEPTNAEVVAGAMKVKLGHSDNPGYHCFLVTIGTHTHGLYLWNEVVDNLAEALKKAKPVE